MTFLEGTEKMRKLGFTLDEMADALKSTARRSERCALPKASVRVRRRGRRSGAPHSPCSRGSGSEHWSGS